MKQYLACLILVAMAFTSVACRDEAPSSSSEPQMDQPEPMEESMQEPLPEEGGEPLSEPMDEGGEEPLDEPSDSDV